MAVPETTMSLRERSKARRRELIRRTAMRLFAERGYEHATIADIAAEAEVAPRTVTMYFPTKADIALSVPREVAGRLAAVFKEDPCLGFLEAIDRWLTAERHLFDPELAALTGAMFDTNPDLRSLSGTAVGEASMLGGPAFRRDVGLSQDDPLAAVIGAGAGAVITEYLFTGLHAPGQPALHAAFMHTLSALVTSAP